ncbi:biotin--[acetyl-CoA-carboxylase] ligase [Winogradskyella flava]|uniref:Biotin--[acetyl-CoA-carboxylase] ligase n=1 Tax=Winogradskyella flava TaxID=1884876 RepID=A0A842IWZ9_9FLAO|nr:biotin--[acetyl-CoA-carboxylase] ligase [Winogradskyella flava]MBC2846639.1 biotin--[acetyl-CoA-carboxylase] ligase [Winogradskyella flava]
MYIIKLDAIDSTNSHLRAMTSIKPPKDFTVVVTEHQTDGRGQMGTNWQTEKGKNLTASVFKKLNGFKVECQFYISMVVSLSICKALKQFQIPKLHIKWPNDILSADRKLCGILIENVIKHNQFQGSILGFGLNVNQKQFDELPQASSMSLLAGRIYDKDEVLSNILEQLQLYFRLLDSQEYDTIKSEYEALLFRKGKPSTFRTTDNKTFTGIIKGVTDIGKLKVLTEDDIIKTFDLKEVTLLY